MQRILTVFVAMAFLAFGFAPTAFAAGMDKSISSEAKDLSAGTNDVSAWIGKDVKNSQGEDLGRVSGFVRDENGEPSLVIVSNEEKNVAAPYDAFSFNEQEDYVLLNITKEQLASAPEVSADEDLGDRAFAEEVYTHFGERPSWTGADVDVNSPGYP